MFLKPLTICPAPTVDPRWVPYIFMFLICHANHCFIWWTFRRT
jgi:hypothetical protein